MIISYVRDWRAIRFITGSYDRTCTVWSTQTGKELVTLTGHTDAVFQLAFNNPYGDRIITGMYSHNKTRLWCSTRWKLRTVERGYIGVLSLTSSTGSLDKTCKLWDANTGVLYHTYTGHTKEVLCVGFNPYSSYIATGSSDNSCKIWDVEKGVCVHTLSGHFQEVASVDWSNDSSTILTASFDKTCRLWDPRSAGMLIEVWRLVVTLNRCASTKAIRACCRS